MSGKKLEETKPLPGLWQVNALSSYFYLSIRKFIPSPPIPVLQTHGYCFKFVCSFAVQNFGYHVLQIDNPTTFYCLFPTPDLTPWHCVKPDNEDNYCKTIPSDGPGLHCPGTK